MNDLQQPYFALRLLKSFCPLHLYEEIEGDLLQKFERDAKKYNTQKAKRRLLWNVLRFFRPGIILRNKISLEQNRFPMFRNYFITSLRHIRKSKMNFTFKLGGLSLAIFSFLAITIYGTFQFSFDTFHRNYQNIYRVNSIRIEDGKEVKCASVPSAMGAALKAEFPEVKSYSIVSEWGMALMRYNEKLFRSGSFIEADSSVFNVFTFQFISGNKKALVKPGGIVITKTLAHQLFGNEDPVQKLIAFPDRFDRLLEVRAVIEDLPAQSSLDVKAIISYGALRDQGDGDLYSWKLGYGGNLFVMLQDDVDVPSFQENIKPLLSRNLPRNFEKSEEHFQIFLQPLSDIYFSEPLKWEFDRKGNLTYLYFYFSLAAFLLVIAGINYVNLSIADFSFRNKEIGVRKVLGARKSQVVFQIIIETMLYCLSASIIGVAALYLTLPWVEQLFGFDIGIVSLFTSNALVWIIISIILLMLSSAAYPAYCLSVNSPTQDLKGKQMIGGSLSLNNLLLLTQFVISILCLTATWTLGTQLKYIQTKDIGFNRNNLLEIFMPDRYPLEKAPVLKEEVSRIAGIKSASFSYYHITGVPYFNAWYKIESDNGMKQVMLNELFVDKDFIQTMGLTLIDGRNFESAKEFKSAFIVNETAVREFGWLNPIGKRIAVGHDQDEEGIWSEGTVIGVVKDFNTRSLHRKIEPLVMRLQYDDWLGYCLNIRYTGLEQDVLHEVKKVYERVLPGFLLDFGNVNERYTNQYMAEKKAWVVLQTATSIVLLISFFGILSMSLFISFKRQKEFGIRKVMGASTTQITSLHLIYFIKIGLLANIIALPVAYFLIGEWLNGFAYKPNLSPLHLFPLACLLLISVIMTAAYSAWKSGRMNPVDVIKAD